MTEKDDVLNQEQEEGITDTSHIDDVEDDEDLFGDYHSSNTPDTDDDDDQDDVDDEEEDEEGAEGEEGTKSNKPTETNKDSQVASSQDQPFLNIKYNKEDVGLSKEEAIEFAQKGKNYDHLKEKYDLLNTEMDNLARANGMSVQDYIRNLRDVQNAFELNREVEALKEQYPNSPDELLQEVAQSHLRENANVLSKQKENEVNAKRQEINRQLDVFIKMYPNVDPQKLDKSVYEKMNEGFTLSEAYSMFKETERQGQLAKKQSLEKIEKQNQENKKKSLGNTTNNGVDEKDEFLSELFGDD